MPSALTRQRHYEAAPVLRYKVSSISDCFISPQSGLFRQFSPGGPISNKTYCGRARIRTRLLFWSDITAVFVRLSTAAANCDWLPIPRVFRVAKTDETAPTVSTMEEVLDVELIVSKVPVW